MAMISHSWTVKLDRCLNDVSHKDISAASEVGGYDTQQQKKIILRICFIVFILHKIDFYFH